MDYCVTCRRHINGALLCPGCGELVSWPAAGQQAAGDTDAPADRTAPLPAVADEPDDAGSAEAGQDGPRPRSGRHAAAGRGRRRALLAGVLGVAVLGFAVAEVGDRVLPSGESTTERDIEAADSPPPRETEPTEEPTEDPAPTERAPQPTAEESTPTEPAEPETEEPTEDAAPPSSEPPPPTEHGGTVEPAEPESTERTEEPAPTEPAEEGSGTPDPAPGDDGNGGPGDDDGAGNDDGGPEEGGEEEDDTVCVIFWCW